MYSRYTPNRTGGFDRRSVPEPAPPETPFRAQGPPPQAMPGPPMPPPIQRRPPAAPAPPPGFPLFRLLPRGLDPEELLILAVLLLAMKQDGASGTELLLAAGLYLWL